MDIGMRYKLDWGEIWQQSMENRESAGFSARFSRWPIYCKEFRK